MTIAIAVSGKGGTGKSTLAALMIRCLTESGARAILAVDADPNACLGVNLGVEPAGTIADLRDDVVKYKPENPSLSKLEEFEMGCQYALTEARGFDLLTMGRPEGPKCYCAANHVLRKFLDQLGGSYGFVITDNEAGMEHLSRRTTNNVDHLFIVGEPTKIGKLTAKRIVDLTASLPISIGSIGVIWNKCKADVGGAVDGIDFYGNVPDDEEVMDAAFEGKAVFDLAAENKALLAVRELLQRKSII